MDDESFGEKMRLSREKAEVIREKAKAEIESKKQEVLESFLNQILGMYVSFFNKELRPLLAEETKKGSSRITRSFEIKFSRTILDKFSDVERVPENRHFQNQIFSLFKNHPIVKALAEQAKTQFRVKINATGNILRDSGSSDPTSGSGITSNVSWVGPPWGSLHIEILPLDEK